MPANTFIIGVQCTGKTTLVLELEKLLSKYSSTEKPVIIHEVVRGIMSTNHFTADDFGTERWIDLQQCTMKAQIKAEASLHSKWFISDRSVLDPVIYAQLQSGSPGKMKDIEGWKASVQRMRDGLVILCQAGQRAWLSSDAVRIAFEDIRQWEAMDKRFMVLLRDEGIPYHLLSKDVVSIKKRAEFVVGRLLL